MRTALLHAVAAAALAAALCIVGSSALAQDESAPRPLGLSTGYNLLPQALSLIEATRAGVAFEAVPDSRFRLVRHIATRFPCAFQPASEAVVTVVAGGEGVAIGEDSVCFEHIDNTDFAYRITRFAGQSLDEVFANARAAAGGWLSGEAAELEGAPLLSASPHQPDVAVDMPRRQALLVGQSPQGPAMLRIAVVQLPDGWYVTQNYFATLDGVPEEQQAQLAVLGSALAEASLAVQLSEMLSPTTDPALSPQ
jgi:predicted RNase H-like HicB family nuclease